MSQMLVNELHISMICQSKSAVLIRGCDAAAVSLNSTSRSIFISLRI